MTASKTMLTALKTKAGGYRGKTTIYETLKAYLEEYGLDASIDDAVAAKLGWTELKLSFVAILFEKPKDDFWFAEIATVDQGLTWEMQNDSCSDSRITSVRYFNQNYRTLEATDGLFHKDGDADDE